MGLVVLLIVFGAMYALLIIPQQRRMKAQRELINALEAGDEVVTSSGIHGAIAEVEGDVIWLEVAPDVELKILKSAVTAVVSGDGATDDGASSDVDVDDEPADDEREAADG